MYDNNQYFKRPPANFNQYHLAAFERGLARKGVRKE